MSAFDLSYNNYFTCDMGELIPALVLPVMPADRIQYAPTFQVRFAPMLNPVFADIYAKVECFFVPYRLLWDSWKTYITGVNQSGLTTDIPTKVPSVVFSNIRPGTNTVTSNQLDGIRLADFFGAKGLSRLFRVPTITDDYKNFEFNCFPFRAYTLIWNEYYRDEFVDKPRYIGIHDSRFGDIFIGSNNTVIDDYGIYHRRWQKDYFTTATPYPQLGSDASGVQVTISGTEVADLKGFFSIAQFRVANALQRFLERTNIGGGRYNEFILAHFGCMPTDATIQRPEFLGSVTAPVQVSAVTQTSQAISDNTKSNTLGAQGGTASAVGTNMCFRRSFQEYGVILGLFSVFPKSVYSDGVSRYLTCGVKGSRFDFGFPEFAGVGDQQIDSSELATWLYAKNYGSGFGYQQRYAEFKFMNDEVHGDFSIVDSGLAQYTFARFFLTDNGTLWTPTLNSDFLECVPRADCFVLKTKVGSSATSVNQCWVQLRNNIKVIRALPKFSTPTL